MTDIELVVKIDEKDYQSLKDGHIPFNVLDVIKNGMIIPKGHGRLIDANSIYQIVRPIEEGDDGWGMTGETAIRLMHEAFNRSPTIVEADTESE